jgi:hypothetical protein
MRPVQSALSSVHHCFHAKGAAPTDGTLCPFAAEKALIDSRSKNRGY